jgi:hypothetical protein
VRKPATLAPSEVRGRLFEALAPVQSLAERFAASGACDVRALRYVVQPHPLVVQITLAPDEGRPALRLFALEARRLPDRGRALEEAVEQFTAAILASLPEETATAAVLNTAALADASAESGLFVMCDPTDETAVLALAEPGKSLGEGVYIGGLANAPERTH